MAVVSVQIPRTLLIAITLLLSSLPAVSDEYRFYHENVLGTDLELQVSAPDAAQATEVESKVLAEIDRLAAILSGHDHQSELQQWQAAAAPEASVSPDLMKVLRAADEWNASSAGAFNPAVASISQVWRDALAKGQTPNETVLTHAVARSAQSPWKLDPTAQTATLTPGASITLDGLAKGYIIDRAAEVAMATPEITGVMVNIGGDLRVMGTMALQAGVANPFSDGEGARPIARIPVHDGAVATSGNYHRYVDLDGTRYSHIVNPKSGLPVDHIASATVRAANATDADALATALNVMPVASGLKLVEAQEDAACLLVTRDGRVETSSRWNGPRPDRVVSASAQKERVPVAANDFWGGRYSLSVNFDVANPDTDGRYRRPYVGIWVCDGEGFPIRTLLLWQQKDGLRWLPSLREWYRDDQIRSFVDDTDLIKTMSRSTRPPGNYDVVWDGKDDLGQDLPPGKYGLRIEAAREHGTHQVIKQDLMLGETPFALELEGNVEISHARINYRRLDTQE